jgi:hypothetical protein
VVPAGDGEPPRLSQVEGEVVMVAAGRDEGGAAPHPLGQLEAEHAAVEVQSPLQVGDLEMDVADDDAGVDGAEGWGHGAAPFAGT